jgi:hypothetical protein
VHVEAPKKNDSAEYARLVDLVLKYDVAPEITSKWCAKAGVSDIQYLDKDQTLSCITYVEDKYVISQEEEEEVVERYIEDEEAA